MHIIVVTACTWISQYSHREAFKAITVTFALIRPHPGDSS